MKSSHHLNSWGNELMDHIRNFLIGWLILGLSATACAARQTQIPTVEQPTTAAIFQLESPTVIASAQPSNTPQSASTEITISTNHIIEETQIFVPTPSWPFPTAVSSGLLNSHGPWLTYISRPDGNNWKVAAVNPNGSGRRQLTLSALSIVGSPASPYLAMVSDLWEFHDKYAGTLALSIVHLPEMSFETIPLISNPSIKDFDKSQLKSLDPGEEKRLDLIKDAIGGPAWSPDGRYLAFPAAIDKPTSDLYIYDTLNAQIRRLTDGSEMVTHPEWSPNSKWIVYRSISGYLGEGCHETGIWAVALDGSQVKPLDTNVCIEITRWIGPETFETFTPPNGGAWPSDYVGPVQSLDIETGTSTFLSWLAIPGDISKPMIDCINLQKIGNVDEKNISKRFDSPDEKWFVVANDSLRLFTTDGKLISEFRSLDQFFGWQPDSKAFVFTTPGNLKDRRTINYLQPADQIMKSFVDSLPISDNVHFDQVYWGYDPSSFFFWFGSFKELDYFNPDKAQFFQVDLGIGNIFTTNFSWVGLPKMESKSVERSCYLAQP